MTITEKVAYLKGLAEGLSISDETKEGKLLLAIVDILDDMALTMDDMDEGIAELGEQIDEIDEDLGTLEEEIYGDDDDFEEMDIDDEIYEVECPSCGDIICIDEGMLEEGEMNCPNCGELLEFEIEEECTCGEDCDCNADKE